LHLGRLPRHYGGVGVDVGGHAFGEGHVAHPDGVADGQPGDVDLQVGGDPGRGRLHRQTVQLLVDHAVALVHLDRLAHDGQGDVDGDDLVPAHDHEVDVPDRSPHRVALQLAGHGQVRGAVHLEGEQGVETGVGGQGGPQLTAVHRYGLGLDPVAVQDGGDLARGP